MTTNSEPPKNKNIPNHLGKHSSDNLFQKATRHIDQARDSVQKSINAEMIRAYWSIGRDIVIEEQGGSRRADYGKSTIKALSKKLQKRYKRGFSVQTLEKTRKFYLTYPRIFGDDKSPTVSGISGAIGQSPNLSWSHYVEILTLEREGARDFYAIEASKNRWTVRELRRQMDSFLYDRLTKSKTKNEILDMARNGQEINRPEDAIKEPMVLEFLGLPEQNSMSESALENALINNLQDFLLELGKGFSFIARQKRLSFDNNHFYADLVFYHVILKCYVVIDLKTHALNHSDLGQMQLYVNYFDMEIKQENDNPTIGLVLCTKKCDEMAKYMLGDKAKQIFASTYQFHLPTVEELENQLKREIRSIKNSLDEN